MPGWVAAFVATCTGSASLFATDAFAHHGVLKALADYQARKLKAEASKPVRATKSGVA
jgi:hypothetical protein